MRKINPLTSLTEEEFEIFLKYFDKKVKEKHRTVTLLGKRKKIKWSFSENKNSSLLGSEEKLTFILVYLKENITQAVLGKFFNMSQGKVNQWIKWLLPVLEETIKHMGYMPEISDEYTLKEGQEVYVTGDVTEHEIQRNKDWDAQKEEYS